MFKNLLHRVVALCSKTCCTVSHCVVLCCAVLCCVALCCSVSRSYIHCVLHCVLHYELHCVALSIALWAALCWILLQNTIHHNNLNSTQYTQQRRRTMITHHMSRQTGMIISRIYFRQPLRCVHYTWCICVALNAVKRNLLVQDMWWRVACTSAILIFWIVS